MEPSASRISDDIYDESRRIHTQHASAAGTPTALREFSYSPSIEHGKSLRQLQQEFLDLRFGMFMHLNMATCEQREWSDPKVSPQ